MAHLSVDGKNKVSCTAAVHRHMGLFHTTALQAYLKQGSRTTDHGSNHHHIGSYLQLFSLVEEGCLMETLASLFPYCSNIRTQCLDEMQEINLASSFLFAVGIPNLDYQGLGVSRVPAGSVPTVAQRYTHGLCPGAYKVLPKISLLCSCSLPPTEFSLYCLSPSTGWKKVSLEGTNRCGQN